MRSTFGPSPAADGSRGKVVAIVRSDQVRESRGAEEQVVLTAWLAPGSVCDRLQEEISSFFNLVDGLPATMGVPSP